MPLKKTINNADRTAGESHTMAIAVDITCNYENKILY